MISDVPKFDQGHELRDDHVIMAPLNNRKRLAQHDATSLIFGTIGQQSSQCTFRLVPMSLKKKQNQLHSHQLEVKVDIQNGLPR